MKLLSEFFLFIILVITIWKICADNCSNMDILVFYNKYFYAKKVSLLRHKNESLIEQINFYYGNQKNNYITK